MPGRRIVMLDMATEDAEAFVRKVVEHGGLLTRTDDDEPYNLPATVAAVVAKPTVWCKCPERQESNAQRRRRQARRESGWMRGAKFGWWMCSNCKRTSRACVIHFITSRISGLNDLLPQILGTGEPISGVDRWKEERSGTTRSTP